MDHYSTLGVDKSASTEDITKAFRKAAMKHHPDRGGDQKKFQELNEAYSTLSDPQKRAEYDMMGQNPFGGFHQAGPFANGFHFNTGNPFQAAGHPFQDIFNNFGFQFHTGQQPVRNRDLNIRCRISLKDAYLGKQMTVNFRMPSGSEENLSVDIPPGIEHGQVIKLGGYGDDSIKHVPRGDLTIQIEVDPVPYFQREGMTLVTEKEVNIFDAMIGTTITFENIDGSQVDIKVPPGSMHGQRLSCKGLGFKHMRFNERGDLHVVLNIRTPKVTDPKLVNVVKDVANRLKKN